MKAKIFALSLLAASFSLSACEELADEALEQLLADWLGTPNSNLRIEEASMQGDLDTVMNLQAPSALVEPGWDSTDYTTFTITGESQEGLIMQIVEIDGGLDHPMLQEEGTYTNDCDEVRTDDSAPPLMMVTGCSKDDPDGYWDYDDGCEEATIVVEEDPSDPDVLMYTLTSVHEVQDMFGSGSEMHTVTSNFRARRIAEGEEPTTGANDDDIASWVAGQIAAGGE